MLLDTVHKKKSAAKTTIIMVLLILSFFFVGMTYLDPPEEMGIEVNLGNSDVGSGNIQALKPVKSAPKVQQQPKEIQEEIPKENVQKEVITQQTDAEAPVVKPVKKPKTEPKPKPEKPKPAKPKPKPKPKPDQSTSDALNNILHGATQDGASSQGEGNDNKSGDKGQIDGNPYANSYYGSGSGTGGNGNGYGLKGRTKTSSNKFPQKCDEEGRVVVKITVDKQGRVIEAIPGVKGTTNSAPCLLEPAKKTALSYRFNPDAKAPKRQIGFIVINFSLN